MDGSDQGSVFDEIADIIRYVEYQYPKPVAKKLRRAAKLLAEVSGIISRLPDNFAQPVPTKEAEALIQTRKDQDCSFQGSEIPGGSKVQETFELIFLRPGL